MHRLLRFGLPLCALVLAGAGCGQRVAQETIEGQINREIADEGRVDFKDDSWTFESNEGDRVAYGSNVSIPADFPSDIPVYAGVAVLGVSSQADGKGHTLTLTTSDAFGTVVSWYGAQMASWTRTGLFSSNEGQTGMYEKDGVQMTVSIASADGTTTVIIARVQDE